MGQENIVDVTACYRLDSPGIVSQWGVRFSAHIQTSPGDHPASYRMGTRSFLGEKWLVRGVDPPPNLMPRSKKV